MIPTPSSPLSSSLQSLPAVVNGKFQTAIFLEYHFHSLSNNLLSTMLRDITYIKSTNIQTDQSKKPPVECLLRPTYERKVPPMPAIASVVCINNSCLAQQKNLHPNLYWCRWPCPVWFWYQMPLGHWVRWREDRSGRSSAYSLTWERQGSHHYWGTPGEMRRRKGRPTADRQSIG